VSTETKQSEVTLPSLWTIRDVSAFLGVPVGTLYQWRHRGDGPPALRLGKHLRFDPDMVRRWALDQAC
jgi:excisionase family DNA binding protein